MKSVPSTWKAYVLKARLAGYMRLSLSLGEFWGLTDDPTGGVVYNSTKPGLKSDALYAGVSRVGKLLQCF